MNRHPWSRCCIAVGKEAEEAPPAFEELLTVSEEVSLYVRPTQHASRQARIGKGMGTFIHSSSFSQHSVMTSHHCTLGVFPRVAPGTGGGDRGLMGFIHSLLHLVNPHPDLLPLGSFSWSSLCPSKMLNVTLFGNSSIFADDQVKGDQEGGH